MIPDKRFLVVPTMLAVGALLAIVFGFWMVFHPILRARNSPDNTGFSAGVVGPSPTPTEAPAPKTPAQKPVLSRQEQVAPPKSSESAQSAPTQIMNASPNAIQAGRDVYVNQDRKLTKSSAADISANLSIHPCDITVGVWGMGGESDVLAESLLKAFDDAHMPVPPQGPSHGIGLGRSFTGIQIRIPSGSKPECIKYLEDAMRTSNLEFSEVPDNSLTPGQVYLYVGTKQ